MQRSILAAFVVALSATATASAQTLYAVPPPAPARMVLAAQPQQVRGDLGGGFIEFLFGQRATPAAPPASYYSEPSPPESTQAYAGTQPTYAVDPVDNPTLEQHPLGFRIDPQFLRQEVAYQGKEQPGTVVVDTPHHFLYLVEGGGKAMRYGIGVGRPGFTWSGVHTVSAKKEWPDWVPPAEMLQRQPGLPHFMAGGPTNPLGARALYLGSTLYRIHGSNEPWTIGHNVSSGCIRMRNVDVIDLYDRVNVGSKVVVL